MSAKRHKNWVGWYLWPTVNFSSQLKQSPHSRRKAISASDRHLIVNGACLEIVKFVTVSAIDDTCLGNKG